MHRKLKIAFAAMAISAGFAGQAQAATSTVRLHTAADTTRFLSDTPSGVELHKDDKPFVDVVAEALGLPRLRVVETGGVALVVNRWRLERSDGSTWKPGYATYRNVQTGRCLTGRGLQGFPVVTAQTCVAGATNQQWRLGVSGDFQLRLNGLVAKHNTAGNQTGVLMSLFTSQNNQKWHTHAA